MRFIFYIYVKHLVSNRRPSPNFRIFNFVRNVAKCSGGGHLLLPVLNENSCYVNYYYRNYSSNFVCVLPSYLIYCFFFLLKILFIKKSS
jgi:hypothetical protein